MEPMKCEPTVSQFGAKTGAEMLAFVESLLDTSSSASSSYVAGHPSRTLCERTHEIVSSPGCRQYFVDALLGKAGSDERYLQMFALLPDAELQNFVLEIVKYHSKPTQVKERSALLLTLIHLFPKAKLDDISDLLMDTINVLIEEGSRKFTVYNNSYHFIVAAKLFPLCVITCNKADLIPFFRRTLSVSVKYYLSCILTSPTDEEIVTVNPDSCWQSIFQLLNELFIICKISWFGFWSPSVSLQSLEVWYRTYIKWRRVCESNKRFSEDLDFLLIITFWAFLLDKYSCTKALSETPQRRPFMMRCGPFHVNQMIFASKNLQERKSSSQLEKILKLSQSAWDILNDDHRTWMSETYSNLRLDESPVFISFRSDLAVMTGRPLAVYDAESFPYWLKTQILAQHIAQSVKPPMTHDNFQDICRLARRLRVQENCDFSSTVFENRVKPLIAYIWDDHELVIFSCAILLDQLQMDLTKLQSLDRVTDQHLQVALVLIQPVMGQYADLFRQIFAVLESRQKFSFTRFFDYIVTQEIVAEISLLLGRVLLELRTESPSTVISVHKTRGANRESTEALLTDLQRHALLSCTNGNAVKAAQNYLITENDTIARVFFGSGDNMSQSSKRMKGN